MIDIETQDMDALELQRQLAVRRVPDLVALVLTEDMDAPAR